MGAFRASARCGRAGGGVSSPATLPHHPSHPRPVSIPLAIALVFALGALLVFAATRATATVEEGRTFIRWMLVVFVAFVVLASLPVVVSL